MAITTTIKNILVNTDKKDIVRYAIIYFSIFGVIFILSIFWHNRSINKAKLNYKNINKERKKTQNLLNERKILELQEQELNEILSQDKNFRIIEAYNNIINNLDLEKYVTEAPTPIEDQSGKHIERKIPINLNNITTKQLVELLSEIQKDNRLFTKELTITKPAKSKNKIDIILVVATLEEIDKE